MTILRLGWIRTDVGVRPSIGAAAVIGECSEIPAVDQAEVVLDDVLARVGVFTKPGGVSVRGARDTRDVSVRPGGVALGVVSGYLDQ